MSEGGSRLERALVSMGRRCEAVSELLGSEIGPDDLRILSPLIRTTLDTALSVVSHLKEADTCR